MKSKVVSHEFSFFLFLLFFNNNSYDEYTPRSLYEGNIDRFYVTVCLKPPSSRLNIIRFDFVFVEFMLGIE